MLGRRRTPHASTTEQAVTWLLTTAGHNRVRDANKAPLFSRMWIVFAMDDFLKPSYVKGYGIDRSVWPIALYIAQPDGWHVAQALGIVTDLMVARVHGCHRPWLNAS
jgi:hypothetical protein